MTDVHAESWGILQTLEKGMHLYNFTTEESWKIDELLAASRAMEAAFKLHGSSSIFSPWVFYAEDEADECYFCSGIEPRHIPDCTYAAWEALHEA